MLIERVITLDQSDCCSGSLDKLEAHRLGIAHLAVSVMLRNTNGQVLLQRRHIGKYHCGGLWANTCCGHPRPGELPSMAASRRLKEEMGIKALLHPVGVFRYRCEVTNELIENELVHLFVGMYSGCVRPNPSEVDEVLWIDPDRLLTVTNFSEGRKFAPWFNIYCRSRPDFIAGLNVGY